MESEVDLHLVADRFTWTPSRRLCVFMLGASSIAGLVLQFYGLVALRAFTIFCTIPASVILVGLALRDRRFGAGSLCRAVWLGAVAGFIACIAYDIFRVPFVLMHAAGSHHWLALPLFKVFPRFGALLLNQPIEQQSYSLAAHSLGWLYHFSNGLGFGVMYVAAIGDPLRRHWLWAVVMAVGLELAMLFMPYANTFSIQIGLAFVLLTLAAHLVFGVTLGLTVRRVFSRRKQIQNLD